jgi:soluble lytic murein transglycosylase-like protein
MRTGPVQAGLLLCVVLFALIGASRQDTPDSRVAELENLVAARTGELNLLRIEMSRLRAIHDRSARHDIPSDLAGSIYDGARSEGLDVSLAFSLVDVESRFAPDAVSSAGAVGLTQVMPATAYWLDPQLAYEDLFRTETNLSLGFRYLNMLLEQYRGDLRLALLAYNRGPARVDSIRGAGGDPSNGYSEAVMREAAAR